MTNVELIQNAELPGSAASAALREQARDAHLELAERYEDMLAAIGANDRHCGATFNEAA